MEDLLKKHCSHDNIEPIKLGEAKYYLENVTDWAIQGNKITKRFNFKNFKETIKFVDKVAKIAEQENHHPYMEVAYNFVIINLTTRSIQGLSENDFILAAKIDTIKNN